MAEEQKRRRVWVLGAGFSKSLGGPLLGDLLSWNAQAEVQARYPNLPCLNHCSSAYWLFHYGIQFREGAPRAVSGGVRAWDDAEGFLELLDVAKNDSATDKRIQDLLTLAKRQMSGIERMETRNLATLARRLVAAACCCFLDGVAPTELERWAPYRDWLKQLGPTDTLVTFNYDRVLELLSDAAKNNPLYVVTDNRKLDRYAQQTAVFKLHGSVDWKADGSQVCIEARDFALHCEDAELALATPGPSKSAIARDLFASLWDRAEERLRTADEVYFLGYRFPPSDAEARSRLLGALAKNEVKRLRLHIVLGPDLGSPDVVRLEKLLEAFCQRDGTRYLGPGLQAKQFDVQVHPLWVEDFLAVWSGV